MWPQPVLIGRWSQSWGLNHSDIGSVAVVIWPPVSFDWPPHPCRSPLNEPRTWSMAEPDQEQVQGVSTRSLSRDLVRERVTASCPRSTGGLRLRPEMIRRRRIASRRPSRMVSCRSLSVARARRRPSACSFGGDAAPLLLSRKRLNSHRSLVSLSHPAYLLFHCDKNTTERTLSWIARISLFQRFTNAPFSFEKGRLLCQCALAFNTDSVVAARSAASCSHHWSRVRRSGCSSSFRAERHWLRCLRGSQPSRWPSVLSPLWYVSHASSNLLGHGAVKEGHRSLL